MNTQIKEALLRKVEGLDKMPTLPVTLMPLLRYLEQPLDKLDIQQVVDLISQDKSLSAQCLQMANSPLFGRWQNAENVRSAVVALGLQRMRDIALSCSVLTLLPPDPEHMDPVVFWEHSLGCALVCRQFARKIKYPNTEKAYLGGLLHDIGIVAHLWLAPKEFEEVLNTAKGMHIPLHEAECNVLGITHCETGKLLAERWHLSADLVSVVQCHHDVTRATSDRDLVALVSLSDLLCRMGGLGYGYSEDRQVNLTEEPGFEMLLKECPALENFDWARFTFELESYLEEVHRLVTQLYRPA
ncbi:MAG TPA: HDOD domain-containing protein [Terriglobales bacterium]|jgi:HD-like signal output (HDOD) protein